MEKKKSTQRWEKKKYLGVDKACSTILTTIAKMDQFVWKIGGWIL